MKYYDRAVDTLRKTEDALRAVMTEALAEQAYREVASIAAMADAVAALVRPSEPSTTDISIHSTIAPAPPIKREIEVQNRKRSNVKLAKKPLTVTSASAPGRVSSSTGARSRSKPEDYPRFEREADRLVKIGWSERDRRVYEHRAPREVVFRFARLLENKTGEGAFTMDDLLPVQDENGKDLPSYQCYLAMAWLRSLGIIQRVGKDGYSAKPDMLTPEALDQFWSSLKTR